jgi:nitrogen fixation NifU-like protein
LLIVDWARIAATVNQQSTVNNRSVAGFGCLDDCAVYSSILLDHCNHPRNVGSFDPRDPDVATGVARDEVCGDVIRLQLRVDPAAQLIREARFKTFGCAPAIAASSLITEWLRGRTLESAASVAPDAVADALALPSHKLHCATLAVAAIRQALDDWESRHGSIRNAAGGV